MASGVPTLSASQILRISRQTNRTTAEISFSSDSVLTDTDLNKSNNQARFLALESIDRTNEGIAIDENDSSRYNLQVDSNDKKIFGVATPTVDNEAANKAYVDGNANIATVAGQISPTNNIASVAGQITPTNNISTVAGKVGDIEKVAHLEDGTTATSAVSKVASRESEIEKLGTDAMTDTSTGYLTKLGVDSMSNATTGNLKKVGDKATEVESVAGKVTEIDTIVNKYDGTDASSGTNKNLVQIDVVADAVAHINTVATNIGNVNNFANTYLGAVDGGTDHSNAPTSNRTEGDLYYNTNSSKKGLFVYNGSAWESLETEISGNIVTSTTGENLTLTTPSDSNNVVINSTTGTSGNTILLPKVRATENNYVLAMSDTSTGETVWQVTATAPTITSISGLLNEDSDSTLTIIGSDFNANTTVKLFSASTGGTEVASATVDTSGISSKLVATFGHANLTAGDQLFVELSNSGITARHPTGITVNVDPTATFSGGSGANYSASTHLGTYGAQIDGGGQDSDTKLLLNFDRTGGTDIEDGSNTGGNGHKITATNAVIKASPFGDGKSAMYFGTNSGSSDNEYLTIPQISNSFAFGTGAFTIECWVMFLDDSTNDQSFIHTVAQGQTATDTQFNMIWNGNPSSRHKQIIFNSGNAAKHIGGTLMVKDRWYHVAVVRDGSSNLNIYIDGKKSGSTYTTSWDISAGHDLEIGRGANNGGNSAQMYLDEVRICKGLAVYTGDFTVPTSRLSATQSNQGTNIADITGTATKLLIHSNKEYDTSGNSRRITHHATNMVQEVITGRSAWGNTAWKHVSSGYLTVPASSDLAFGTGDFTLEAWINLASVPVSKCIGFDQWGSSTGNFQPFWVDSSNKFNWIVKVGSTNHYAQHDTSVTTGWAHYAVVRNGNSMIGYLDGVAGNTLDLSSISSTNIGLSTQDWLIGRDSTSSSYSIPDGSYFQDLRVVKGTAVYTGAFNNSLPSGPLTTTGGTYTQGSDIGNVNTSIPSGHCKLLMLGDGGVFTDSATSDHTITPTGSYHSQAHGGIAPAMTWPASLKETGSAGVYFDGDGDKLVIPHSTDFGYHSAFTWDFFINLSTVQGCRFIDKFSSDLGFYISLQGGNSLEYGWYPSGLGYSSDTRAYFSWTPSANTWYHICVSRASYTDNVYIYVDGTALGNMDANHSNGTTQSGQNTGTGDIGIGSYGNSEYVHGYIDQIRYSSSDETASGGSLYHASANTITVPTKIYGAYTPKTIDTITFTGDTSEELAGDEDIEFSEVTNTNQPAEKQDFSDIGLSITNLTGSNKNKATLTGTLNFANNTSVPKLAMKVQVRKTLGDASYNNSTTVTFGGSTTTIGLSPGMGVTNAAGGSTIPASTTISSVDSSTQITLSQATTGGSQSSQSLIFTDPDRVAHMNGSDTYSTGDTALTIATGDGNPVLFNARRYMGTATKPKSINNFGFSPDMLWFKNRDRSHNHRIFDTVQGVVGSNLVPNDTDDQATNNNAVAEYTSDGFRMGDSGDVNIDNEGHIVWGWKAGGAPVSISNTGNATNITQSASSTTGLSITKFTGPSATADVTVTIPHNLGGTPEFIILKSLSNTFSWLVYHKDSATGTSNSASHYSLHLNSNVGRQTNDGSANDSGHIGTPTNSNIVLSPGVGTNHNNYHTGDVIMYAWKSVDKVSKFGTYTGATDRTVDLDFFPRFFMTKRIDSAAHWMIWDTFRSGASASGDNMLPYISPNNDETEHSSNDRIDLYESGSIKGVQFKSTDNYSNYVSGSTTGTYVYIAFA